MRDIPYAGPSDTNDFDRLSPDEMAKAMYEYQLLGECFETVTDEDMMGRGWAIDNPLILVEGHADNLRRAQRELAAAVALARNQGEPWAAIADALDVTESDARSAYDLRP
ncbi:hypothetical protein SAMN04489740_4273 [Arthrobacter alpinus]|uniref:Uncharacterized protein n=1 Tax=Arthrobacter alpinus TaxID=656366 RepID=A0A1H5PG80_9MICC|nr:hypothetical protein [Arthrobacter alpinus]SEF12674.1 hypothetical protein SAMN04489740_4273 [Arthrobacter alpinus]